MEEEYKFKKGDRVKVIDDTDHSSIKNGWTGTVDENDSIPCVNFDNGREHACHQRRLELIEKSSIADSDTPDRLKVGDQARVIGNTGVPHQFGVGSVVEILRPLNAGGDYYCKKLSGDGVNRNQYIIPADLECIEEESKTSCHPDESSEIDGDSFGGILRHLIDHNWHYDWSPYTHTFSADYGKEYTTNYQQKGVSLMSKLSLLAKKEFDKDTKTLIAAGVLDSDLRVANPQFILSFLVDLHKTEMAKQARIELDETKAERDN